MKLWFKKISVVLITFMTVGMYIPPTYLDTSAKEESKDAFASTDNLDDKDLEMANIEETNKYSLESEEEDFSGIQSSDDYVQMFVNQAREQTLHKLGPTITNKVKDDFMDDIFPNMEEVIGTILIEIDEEEFSYLEINQQKKSIYGEKIFNIYDTQSKEDIARFHVRRDLRPKEGYWFDFHYHLRDDNYEKHHGLGGVYWDKNTPPKWMS